MPEVVLPFKYVGGDPAIDLVNTVDWTRQGLRDERLGDYQRLTRWAEGSGVVSPRTGGKAPAATRLDFRMKPAPSTAPPFEPGKSSGDC